MASLAKIKQDVRVILYRNEGYDTLTDVEGLENIDNLKVDELIDTLIGVAVDKVYALAPTWMLGEIASTIDDGGEDGEGSIGWSDEEDEYASIAHAPNDMLRIVMVKLPKWKKPVTDMTNFDDALYAEYRSEFEGVRPTNLYPAVAVGPNWDGDGIRIEAYPKGAFPEGDAKKPSVRYIRKFDAAQDIDGDNVALAGRVYYSVLYYIASLFYVSIGEKGRADMMEAEAIKLLNYQVTEQ